MLCIKRFIFCFFSAFAISTVALADYQGVAPQLITEISTGWAGEGIYIKGDIAAPGCSSAYYFLSNSTPLFKENLSVLLSAFHAGTQAVLVINGCASTGEGALKAVKLIK